MRPIVAALAAMAVLLCSVTALAQPAHWESIELPATVPEVREALGIRAASPASELILEVARRHFYLPGRNDRTQPGFARLERLLGRSSPGGGGGERVVPLPGGVALWERTTGVSVGGLGRLLLIERDAALFYVGLASLDAATVDVLADDAALASEIFRDRAGVFAAFGAAISVTDGRVQVPGGVEAEGAWASVVGQSPSNPARFIRELLRKDNGRLAYFFDAIASLDPPHLQFVLGPAANREARIAEIARFFGRADPTWRVTSQPFLRPRFDPALALRFAPVTPEGSIAGAPAIDALAYLQSTFATRSGARGAGDGPDASRRAFEAGAAARRVGAAAGAVRAARPSLAIALERMGVTDLALFARVDKAAAALDARLLLREEMTESWQGALALLSAAARNGSVTPVERDALLASLAEAAEARDPFSSMLDWLDAAPGGSDGPFEERLIAWAAGRSSLTPFTWEGQPLAIDLSGSRRAALARVLDHPRRLTLDDIVVLRDVQRRVTANGPLDHAELLAALEPVLPRYAGVARAHAPLATGADAYNRLLRLTAAGTIDPPVRYALGMDLIAAWRTALGDAMRLMAYAQAVNGPGMLATSTADFARRHVFQPPQRMTLGPAGPWEPAAPAAFAGLRLEGSLLDLDLALPEMLLRRPAGEMPAEPAMLAGERLAFARAAVLALDAAGARDITAIARTIADGRRAIAEAATPDALSALAVRAGMTRTRASLVAWEAARDLATARARFSLPEIAALGGAAALPDAHGTSRLPRDGCPCIGASPAARDWQALAGRWDSGLLATVSPDLTLRLVELAAAVDLPGEVIAPLLLAATSDVIERADPATPDDRASIARAVATIDEERFEQYMLALITDGTLVPRGETP